MDNNKESDSFFVTKTTCLVRLVSAVKVIFLVWSIINCTLCVIYVSTLLHEILPNHNCTIDSWNADPKIIGMFTIYSHYKMYSSIMIDFLLITTTGASICLL